MKLQTGDFLDTDKLRELFWKESDFNWKPASERIPHNYHEDIVVVKDTNGDLYLSEQNCSNRCWYHGSQFDVKFYSELPIRKMVFKKGNLEDALESGEIDIIAYATYCTDEIGPGISKILRKPEIESEDSKLIYDIYCMVNPGVHNEVIGDGSDFDDSLFTRIERFEIALRSIALKNPESKIAIPLVLTGDAKFDKSYSDLDYFVTFIYPNIKYIPAIVYY